MVVSVCGVERLIVVACTFVKVEKPSRGNGSARRLALRRRPRRRSSRRVGPYMMQCVTREKAFRYDTDSFSHEGLQPIYTKILSVRMSNAIIVADSRAIEHYHGKLSPYTPTGGRPRATASSTRSMGALATKPASRLRL